MTKRLLTDLVVGILATAVFAITSRWGPVGPILAGFAVVVATMVAAFRERSPKWVWVHAPVMMSIVIVMLMYDVATCQGRGCSSMLAILIFAILVTSLLVTLSYFVFYFRVLVRSKMAGRVGPVPIKTKSPAGGLG